VNCETNGGGEGDGYGLKKECGGSHGSGGTGGGALVVLKDGVELVDANVEEDDEEVEEVEEVDKEGGEVETAVVVGIDVGADDNVGVELVELDALVVVGTDDDDDGCWRVHQLEKLMVLSDRPYSCLCASRSRSRVHTSESKRECAKKRRESLVAK